MLYRALQILTTLTAGGLMTAAILTSIPASTNPVPTPLPEVTEETAPSVTPVAVVEPEPEVKPLNTVLIERPAIAVHYRAGDRVDHPGGYYELKWVWVPTIRKSLTVEPRASADCADGSCGESNIDSGRFRLLGRRR